MRGREPGEVARALGQSPATLAIAWCLRNPNVSSVILGASRPAQLVQNLAALELAQRIGADDWARIEVRDPGPGFDPDIRHTATGYGLRMLDMLAARWGVDRDDQGTRVPLDVAVEIQIILPADALPAGEAAGAGPADAVRLANSATVTAADDPDDTDNTTDEERS